MPAAPLRPSDSDAPTVAIIGASTHPEKFSHRSVLAHRKAGYRVFPVHPSASEIAGLPAYRSVTDISEPLTRVSMYVPAEVGVGLLEEIAAKGCDELFLNPGSESEQLVDQAHRLGLNPIQACSIVDVGG